MCKMQLMSTKKVSDYTKTGTVSNCQIAKNIKLYFRHRYESLQNLFLNIGTIMARTESKIILQIHVTQFYM